MDSRNNNLYLAIIYKLLYDVLFLLLAVLAMLLFAEALIPGYLSGYLSFTKIIFLIFVNLLLISYLHKKIDISQEIREQKKPGKPSHHKPAYTSENQTPIALWCEGKFFFIGLSIFIILLLAASLLKFSWPGITIIILATLAAFYYFHKLIFKDN